LASLNSRWDERGHGWCWDSICGPHAFDFWSAHNWLHRTWNWQPSCPINFLKCLSDVIFFCKKGLGLSSPCLTRCLNRNLSYQRWDGMISEWCTDIWLLDSPLPNLQSEGLHGKEDDLSIAWTGCSK
jgi:hypothetical protein